MCDSNSLVNLILVSVLQIFFYTIDDMQWLRSVDRSSTDMRSPLLTTAQATDDEVVTLGKFALANLAAVRVEQQECTDYIRGLALLIALFCPIALVVYVVYDSWQTNPSNRSWLVLGLGFYIGAAVKAIYEALLRIVDRICFLRVEIRRMSSTTMFEAISNALAEAAELDGRTCSRDIEALQEHDAVTGQYSVRLGFWSRRSRTFRVCVSIAQAENIVGSANDATVKLLHLHVEYSPGEDIVCGRDSRLQSQAVLVLTTRTSKQRVRQDKETLCQWIESCYQKWVMPIEGVVKVYALQQLSSDWTPEWKLERVKPSKNAKDRGQFFYLARDPIDLVLTDAKMWSRGALRVYMVSGPPGVGKSEFIIWLASQLGLSIYRVSLSSTSLSDNLFAQLLSQSSITDNAVLIQVDEFQETVQRWLAVAKNGESSRGVTPGGFCETIQGATAMRRGVVILSGTPDIASEDVQEKLAAVYRRINAKAELSWLTKNEVRMYFINFLLPFLPGISAQDWEMWATFFVLDSPWSEVRPISIDMLQQYLMSRITDAVVKKIGNVAGGLTASESFQVPTTRQNEFFKLICDSKKATEFLDGYARVDQVQ